MTPIFSDLQLVMRAQDQTILKGDKDLDEWMQSLVDSINHEIDNPRQTMSEMVQDFHDKQGIRTPKIVYDEDCIKRFLTMNEEWYEVISAIFVGDRKEIAHEIADLIYTLIGTALVFGIEIEPVFAAIHKANMTKEKGFDKTNYVKPEIKV